jgi:hypothetical protein
MGIGVRPFDISTTKCSKIGERFGAGLRVIDRPAPIVLPNFLMQFQICENSTVRTLPADTMIDKLKAC